MNNLTPRIIRIDYPDSLWGSDLVLFHVPEDVTDWNLVSEIIYRRENYSSYDYGSLQDLTDALLNSVADHFGGTWRYVPTAGYISITED